MSELYTSREILSNSFSLCLYEGNILLSEHILAY